MPRSIAGPSALGVVLAVVLTACGSARADDDPSPTGSADLGGSYQLRSLVAGGADRTSGAEVAFEIDTEFGELRIVTECGTLLGSFTLAEGGRAGVTIAGGSQRGCTDPAQDQNRALLDVLGRVDTWSADQTSLTLEAGSGNRVSLTR